MATERKVTLRDVAQHAGVSRTTASYILNGRSQQMRIATETNARVRAAAQELRYRPNPSARSLRTSTTRTVGVISDFVAGGPFASQMLSGAGEAARGLDHVVVIGESGGDPDLERLLVEEMQHRRVDGIVYATLVTSRISVPASLHDQRVVLLNCVDPDAEVASVLPDEESGGRLAAHELLDAGVDGATWVVGEDPTVGALAGRLRLRGIEAAFAEHDRRVAGVLRCEWGVREAHAVLDAFLAAGHRPAGLVCLNDRIAMGAYQALGEHGLRVPDDVSVVSFDGSDLAGWLRPRLTSVTLPYRELGAEAVRVLLDEDAPANSSRMPMPVSPGESVRRDA